VLFAIIAAVAASPCQAEPPTQAGLLLAEQHWVAALEARDVRALDCLLAPGFTDTNWRGARIGRDAVLSALPQRLPSTLQLSALEAEIHGPIGIVHGVNTQSAPDGTVIGKVRFTDIFLRDGEQWRALSAQETVIR
jgi:hypothetical protein